MEALRPAAARLVLHGDLVADGAAAPAAAVRGHPAGRGRAQRAAVRLLRVRPPHERGQPRILNSLPHTGVKLNGLDRFCRMVP